MIIPNIINQPMPVPDFTARRADILVAAPVIKINHAVQRTAILATVYQTDSQIGKNRVDPGTQWSSPFAKQADKPMQKLIAEIRNCTICQAHLPAGCRPVFAAHPASRIVVIGQYAQRYYLGECAKTSLTETVEHFADYLPAYFPLPHPSPRNNIWLKKNPWFTRELLPELETRITRIKNSR